MAVRMIAELRVACSRLQTLLELPEYKHPSNDPDLPLGFVQVLSVIIEWDVGIG